jgi:hypothetical protein
MADKARALARPLGIGVFEVRGREVMLDARVAEAFGTETKRVNEAIARNPEKFSAEHVFQLDPEEHEALRSQAATSSAGRGGARYAPHVFTMKGVIRLATVLNSEEALRATEMIVDTFVAVYRQLHEGRTRIAVPNAGQFRSSPAGRRALARFKRSLVKALASLLDTLADARRNKTVRAVTADVSSEAIQHIQERLKSKGLENAKLAADTTLVLAQAEQVLAAVRKTEAEADSIAIQNLERRIGVVRELIRMSKELEPAEFVELLSTFEDRAPPAGRQHGPRRLPRST